MSSWHQYDNNKEQHGKDRRKYCFDCHVERWCGDASVWLWGVQVSLTEKKNSHTSISNVRFLIAYKIEILWKKRAITTSI